VAEDNYLNQQVIQHLLARKGHTSEIAGNGREALAALERDGFDLLLLDVHMPEVDGFRVIETLRRREQGTGRRLPVIALTARSMKGDRERCLQAGMDDFLAKPIRRHDLFAAIERVMASRPSTEPQRQEEPPSVNGVLDAATLLTACDADAMLLARMIAIFRDDAPGQLSRIAAAVREGNGAELRESAHKLRGLVSPFSTRAADAAGVLEQAGDFGRLDGTDATYAALFDMVEELAPLLDSLTVDDLKCRLNAAPVLSQPWHDS
jgi:CheY-like chemotaxis protein